MLYFEHTFETAIVQSLDEDGGYTQGNDLYSTSLSEDLKAKKQLMSCLN